MKGFYNLKISAKLLTGFAIVALIAGAVGAFGILNIKKADNSDTMLYENFTVPISEMGNISTAFQRLRVNVRDLILSRTPEEVASNTTKIKDREAEIDKLAVEFEKTILSDVMREDFEKFQSNKTAFYTALEKVVMLTNAQQKDAALDSMSEKGESGMASRAMQDSIDSIVKTKVEQAKGKSADNTVQANKTMTIMGIMVGIAMVLAIGLGLFLSRIISKPLIKSVEMIQEMSKGHLGMRMNMDAKDEVGVMASAMDAFADDLQANVIGVLDGISKGDVSMNIEVKDDKDEISPALKRSIEAIRSLVADANRLELAAVEGKLETRADASKHSGDFAKIVNGVNSCLDAVIGPLNVAAGYVDRISKGDIPPKITDTYNGDFNTIKNNLNNCVDIMNGLLKETNMLIEAAAEGRLSTRADATSFVGDWKKLVQGFNEILEAVIAPVKEATLVLTEMSNGNLQNRVTGNFKGDHADIKNALNNTLDSLSSYVSEISHTLEEMANSNLDLAITNDYKGDFSAIKEALNLIISSLNEVLGEMGNASDQVAAGSRQVSDGSQALSQGSTEQASAVEQLTASITEIAAQTKQNAANASQANELATQARINADQGNQYMQGMLKSMQDINESSNSISKIIKVIDEIAFQTNILALNAAVEAARAGQHGKGFAVVAEEVRNLAARSANAAKETTSMIEGSISKVEDGTKIANETAGALTKIVDGVAKAANLVGEIATASNEQANGIFQINKGVEQVSQVVQTNSATAEQSAAASEELSGQAEMLKEMVGNFRLKRGIGNRAPKASLREPELKKAGKRAEHEPKAALGTPRISLSDGEFGKY